MSIKFLKAAFVSMVILSSTANAGVIDFTALDNSGGFIEVVGENRGTISVVDDILTLSTNSWFYVDIIDAIGNNSLDYANTVLSFDFLTSGGGEISGIQASNSIRGDYFGAFNLYGSQWFGLRDAPKYNNVNEWVHYDINLGQYLSGDFSKIMFINDCDRCSGLDVATSFKNMSITEIPEPSILVLFALGSLALVSRKTKR